VRDTSADQDLLQWSLHVLGLWSVSTLENHEIMEHWPRELNVMADAPVNDVLDGSVCTGNIQVLPARLEAGGTFVVCSDGGSRGNLGPAAAAGLVFLHVDSALYRVALWCVDLGISTSAHAEFEGACLGVHLFILWLLSTRCAQSSQLKCGLR
jgi:hypothetical protein